MHYPNILKIWTIQKVISTFDVLRINLFFQSKICLRQNKLLNKIFSSFNE